MRSILRAALCCVALAGSAAAQDISLSPPIDCDLGRDCYIQQYVDHDPSNRAYDFRCASLSYNTHKGTDFALRTYAQLQAGVTVIASAPGRVKAIRDGEPDQLYGGRFGEVPRNKACGNGVLVEHADGWTTQYCHLRKGSVRVRKGQDIARGEALGIVGLSGRTQFPHVHLTLRRNGKVVDPFDPDGKIICSAPSGKTLWDRPLTYRPGAVLSAGFADSVPEYADVKSGAAAQQTMPRDAPAVVLFGMAFGGRKGDVMRLTITGPNGKLLDERVTLEKNQAQFFRAVGRKRSTSAWPSGTYRGKVTLERGGTALNVEQTRMRIR